MLLDKVFILMVFRTLFVSASTMFTSNMEQKTALPNFIIMLMDDMGYGDLGCFGEPNRETPNLDKMAIEGLIATSMYTSNPLCSPSRASLLTGRLPVRNGFYTTNIHGRNSYTPQDIMGGISETETLLPELLREKGYINKLIGKWHLGHQEQYLPLKRGFDSFFGSTNCHFGPYNDKTTPNIPVFRDTKMVGRYYEEFPFIKSTHESNMTKLYIDEAIRFLNEQKDNKEPFFLLWSPDATHAPTYASKNFLKMSRRGPYGAAVMELDYGVGAILKTLKRAGLSKNTLVVFTSDNGAAISSRKEGGSNGRLLCGKQTTFEGGMRVPGIFWWPGVIPRGAVTHQAWTQMDFFSTFLDLAGISLPNNRTYDGISLVSNLRYPREETLRPVFYYRGDRLMAVRVGPYKLHIWTWNTTPQELKHGIDFCIGQRLKGITTQIPFDHQTNPVLFNIEVDPGEKNPINIESIEYKRVVKYIMNIVKGHKNDLVFGSPQLNWCDEAVMHWSPPGCEALKKCLKAPPSKPHLCNWPH